MKKIAFFLILLGLIFAASGKESGIGEFIDKEKISSEYNIEKEDENSIKFKDKDENSEVYRIFSIEKMLKVDYNNPNNLNHDWKTLYKDEETLIVSHEEADTQGYEYNIHTFDNSKAELAIIVSVGATRKVSEAELVNMLKEAKSFIKK